MEKIAEGKDESQKEEQHQMEKRKHVYPHSNFKDYYSHRNVELNEDPRLKHFKKEWFEGKDCLHIGCNCGTLTIHIAQQFYCRSILGIDIDSGRVEDAYLNLNKTVRLKYAEKKTHVEASKHKDEDHADNLEHGVGDSSNEEIPMELSCLEERNLSDIVSFKQENFVRSQYPMDKHYDTILWLSPTQWILGYDSLTTLFHKIWNMLRLGGVLILEPQSLKSYVSKHNVSETSNMNYKNIKILPEIQEILLDKIGFRTVEQFNPAWTNQETRFNRPILVFQK